MNNPSPLVPQGTQPPRGKSSLYFKILMILSLHVVLIGGMLLQGCKDTSKEQTKDPALSQAGGDTSPVSNSVASTDPAFQPLNTIAMSNQVVATLPAPQPYTTALSPTPIAPTVIPSPSVPVAATVMSPDGKDYVIAKGDTFGAIAKRNSISIKSLMDANPGVSAKKLRVGQKLQIPASTGALAANTSSVTSAAPVEAASAGSASTYTVKSGDTLGKIARTHGTSYKKIMALNELKTTAIRVGQKLKLPTIKTASLELPATSASIASTPGPVSSVSTPVTGIAN